MQKLGTSVDGLFFFFSSRRRHTRLQGDWSSDVCSSDLTTLNLSKRGKWLTGIAALIAAYVAFGPKDSDSVEPAKAAARPAAHTTHAVTSTVSVPVARSLLALAHRVVDQTSAGALFASHSWYVAPPPPPPVAEIGRAHV